MRADDPRVRRITGQCFAMKYRNADVSDVSVVQNERNFQIDSIG